MDNLWYIQEFNTVSICIRIGLAVIFGGVIGLERDFNNHPAGFRTHILVCLGSCLAMLTNQYICEVLCYTSDPARIGAQVITGVGFLGVGTILVTTRRKVKGLTTAAGLWASACLGLALGIGFFEGAIIVAIAILISLSMLERIERKMAKYSRVFNLYMEVENIEVFKNIIKMLKALNCDIFDSELSGDRAVTEGGIGIILSVRVPKFDLKPIIEESINSMEGVVFIDEF